MANARTKSWGAFGYTFYLFCKTLYADLQILVDFLIYTCLTLTFSDNTIFNMVGVSPLIMDTANTTYGR